MDCTLKKITVFNIYEDTVPTTYDSPFQPQRGMILSPCFYGKTYKTLNGAQRAVARHCKLSNKSLEDFEIRENIEEI